uniref:B box-type domain-containing protein n=1 Tax=Timema cristinae TaxID=61476 RepID=A0A7R9CI21_TIMCR|nr:unnamed protein product [Timema cristinae]
MLGVMCLKAQEAKKGRGLLACTQPVDIDYYFLGRGTIRGAQRTMTPQVSRKVMPRCCGVEPCHDESTGAEVDCAGTVLLALFCSSSAVDMDQTEEDAIVACENNVVVCPVCRVHCHANNLIENQFLLEVSGSSSEANATDPSSDLKCTSCHENSPATSWCVECSEYICDGCVQAHQRLKITKEHTIKPKEEANHESPASASSSVPKSLYCSVHRQSILSRVTPQRGGACLLWHVPQLACRLLIGHPASCRHFSGLLTKHLFDELAADVREQVSPGGGEGTSLHCSVVRLKDLITLLCGELEGKGPCYTAMWTSFHCYVVRWRGRDLTTLLCGEVEGKGTRYTAMWDCQLSDHREHKYKFIHEIASETKGMIGGLLQEVSYKRVLLTSAMKVIDDRQNMILDKKKSLVKEITQVVVRLTNAINLRGKQLVLQLNEVCDAKHKTLKEKKVALEQLSSLTDHCIEFVNNALNKGSDMALLYSKKYITLGP